MSIIIPYLGENISYLMHKYKFDMHQWCRSITPLFNQIDLYITSNTVIEDRCTGIAIRELCSIKDGIDHLPFATHYKAVTESMCMNYVTTSILFAMCTGILLLCFVYRFNF